MFAARRLATRVPRTRPQVASFHNTAPAFVQKGDAIPDLDVLVEASPGNRVNLAREIKGKGLIIGTPAAFSMLSFLRSSIAQYTSFISMLYTLLTKTQIGPACSSSHIPGYIKHPKLKDAGQVFVVSVNDPFVYVLVETWQLMQSRSL